MSSQQFLEVYYQLLGVERNASTDAILRAFRQKSKLYHPDKVEGRDELMKLLTMAKVTLLDPDKKAEYDKDKSESNDITRRIDLLSLYCGQKLSDKFRMKIESWKVECLDLNFINNFVQVIQKWTQLKDILETNANSKVNELKPDPEQDEDLTEDKIGDTLADLANKNDLVNIANYIKSHPNPSVLIRVYNELSHGRRFSDLPNDLDAMLNIIKGCHSQLKNKHIESYTCFRKALFAYPTDQCLDAVVILLDNSHKRSALKYLLTKLDSDHIPDLVRPHKHSDKMKSTERLRTVIRYEKGIHNRGGSDFEKAMLYIDLCMACGTSLLVANNFFLATKFLLSAMEDEDDIPMVYAIRNCICELCSTVLYFAGQYLDPISALNYSLNCFMVMKKAHNFLMRLLAKNDIFSVAKCTQDCGQCVDLINDIHQNFFAYINHLVTKSVKVNPLVNIDLNLSGDALFKNMVNQEFLQKYYQYHIDNDPTHTDKHLFQYYLMEGSYKGWIDTNLFEEYRFKTIQSLFEKKGYSDMIWTDISHLVTPTPKGQRPLMNRDIDGWFDINNLGLNLGEKAFNSVDGLTIDIESGTFELILSRNPDIPDLFDTEDIDEILSRGISHSIFSLDQCDSELGNHPFQLMRFGPESLVNSRYLSTLLLADYLLKMLVQKTELSSEPPFLLRDATEGLLNALPPKLRKIFDMDRKQYGVDSAHRFWIEGVDIPYYTWSEKTDHISNGRQCFEFYYSQMAVKTHLLVKNAKGEYVDSEDQLDSEDEDESEDTKADDNQRFALKFTECYDYIGYYFPVFLRLKELLKLNAIYSKLHSTYANILKENLPRKDLSSEMKNIFTNFCHQMRRLGLQTEPQEVVFGEHQGMCNWVPSAYSFRDDRRVYGGVKMIPNLKAQPQRGCSSSGSTSSGRSSSGSSRAGNSGGSGSGGKSPPPSPPPKRNLGKNPERGPYQPGTSIKTKGGTIVRIGPSGHPMLHFIRHNTRKAGKEAAQRGSKGDYRGTFHKDRAEGTARMRHGLADKDEIKVHHQQHLKGKRNPHYHSLDEKGQHTPVHHLVPKE